MNINDISILLRQGEVVLIKTDTNYALACCAWDEKACSRIYQLKNRPYEKPLTLFVSSLEEAKNYCDFKSETAENIFDKIANKYWPGPLNIIVPKSVHSPTHQFFDKDYISLVFNKENLLNRLIALTGPLAMTSANISGEVLDTLVSKNDALSRFPNIAILDSDESRTLENNTTKSSTIIKLVDDNFHVVRQGDLSISL